MNETYDMSTSEGISKDNSVYTWLIPGYASLAILSQLIPGYASLKIYSRIILGYPNLQNLYRDIPGYPDLPRVSFFQMLEIACFG